MRDVILTTIILFATFGMLTWQLSRLYDRIDWNRKCQTILSADDCEQEYERMQDK